MIGTKPGGENEGATAFAMVAKKNNLASDGPFQGEAYDAAAIIALAAQAAGSGSRGAIKSKIMEVANAPGEKIWPGQLAKALKILADGGQVNYEGASLVDQETEHV